LRKFKGSRNTLLMLITDPMFIQRKRKVPFAPLIKMDTIVPEHFITEGRRILNHRVERICERSKLRPHRES